MNFYIQRLGNLKEGFDIGLRGIGAPLGNGSRVDAQLFGEPLVGALLLYKYHLDSVDVFCHVV